MTSGGMAYPGGSPARAYGTGLGGGHEPANLGDILERVLDRGLVIAGDIRVNLLDIELLTIKLRLIIASVETARELGINWWETDPWLTSDRRDLEEENRQLRERVAELEDSRATGRRQEENRQLREGVAELEDSRGTGRREAGARPGEERRRDERPARGRDQPG
jgi:hypothetical protein